MLAFCPRRAPSGSTRGGAGAGVAELTPPPRDCRRPRANFSTTDSTPRRSTSPTVFAALAISCNWNSLGRLHHQQPPSPPSAVKLDASVVFGLRDLGLLHQWKKNPVFAASSGQLRFFIKIGPELSLACLTEPEPVERLATRLGPWSLVLVSPGGSALLKPRLSGARMLGMGNPDVGVSGGH